MSGFFIRLRLFLKLWITSIYFVLIMLSIPIMAIYIYQSGTYTTAEISSMLYEKVGLVWLVFIVQWCLSIDFDSKFSDHLITYPVVKWKYLLERLFISGIIFVGMASAVTIALSISYGSFLWKSLLFTLPIYIAVVGIVLLGTIMLQHSLGGLIGGILFWMFIQFGGIFLKDFNAILLIYQSVESFVRGDSPLLAGYNLWILANRFVYSFIGVGLIGAALLAFSGQRKERRKKVAR